MYYAIFIMQEKINNKLYNKLNKFNNSNKVNYLINILYQIIILTKIKFKSKILIHKNKF